MELLNPGSAPNVAKLSHLPPRPPVDIGFQDLTYTVKSGKTSKIILRGINGEFRSGQLTAILGPSGAGKSSLLNILAGYRAVGATGIISTNGEQRNPRTFKKLSRYILQDNLLQPYITVQEAMLMAADLKLGNELSRDRKNVIVDEIVQVLRLDKARNTSSEKLSGGERKRLSVALELLNNPPVVFLDEPTTGLDDVASSTCLSLLKRIAKGGRTIVCSLHTPSARLFAIFDHVYVVADGRCAYQGTAAGVVPFLQDLQLPCPKTYNPADFVIEVSSGEYGPHLDRLVTAIDNGRNQGWRHYGVEESHSQEAIEWFSTEGVGPHNFKYESTPVQQFVVIAKRMILQTFRNKGYLWLRFSLHLFLGAIVSALYKDMGNDATKIMFNFGFCYSCVIVMLYTPMMPILLSYPTEIQLVKREYFNRWYGLKPYYAALVLARAPVTALFAVLFLALVYPITAQPLELARALQFLVICLMIALISESMATLIASMLNVVNANFVGPVVSVPLMLLAVYGIGSGDAAPPAVWALARACSYLRHGLEGLVAAVYGEPRNYVQCPAAAHFCEYTSVRYFVKTLGMAGSSFWRSFACLLLTLFLMNSATYYMIRQRLSPNYAFRAVKVIGRFIKNKMSDVL